MTTGSRERSKHCNALELIFSGINKSQDRNEIMNICLYNTVKTIHSEALSSFQ
jgi:hypothetical protein